MNFQEVKAKFTSSLGKKSFLLIGFLIIIILLSIIFLISKSSKTISQQDKTWEISLTYNSNEKKLSLEKITVVNRETISDQRNALYSPYKLQVLGKNGNVVFQEKVNITEKILYDILLNAPIKHLPISTDIKSVIFVPYQTDGVKILILRDSDTVLQINLPKVTASNFIQSAQAAQQSISCGPLTTVFINDNYTDIAKFKSDVAYLENLYNTTPPYSPSIFDFKEVDNAQGFGCATNGISWCMNTEQKLIKQAGLNVFGNAQKFIVLVDNPNALNVDGGVAGLVNGIGGDVIIYTNYAYSMSGLASPQPFAAAAHEFEGHAVGYLWDRYVSSDINYAKIAPGDSMSNCSTNPAGEGFWAGAGSTGASQGCGNQSQYAPFPLTCASDPSNTVLKSGGSKDTIMSAIGCSPNQFDSVEQAWITNNILPNYKACPSGAVTAVTPSTTIDFSPTPQTVNVGDTVNLDVTLNPTTNQVSFTKLVINYDSTKLEITPSGPAVCPAKPDDAFCPNVLAFPVVLQGPVYSPGTISVTLSVGGGPTSVIQVSTKIATIAFKAIAPTGDSPTQVTVNVPQSQALSIASTDYFNQNILSSATPADINITGLTPLPTASPAPSGSPAVSPIPTPSSATYNCVLDPTTCNSGQSSIQMCFLKCSPN